MSDEVDKLKFALEQFHARPRAYPLRQAMADFKNAFPGPFDPEASDLYTQCEVTLQSVVPAQQKRKRDTEGPDAKAEPKPDGREKRRRTSLVEDPREGVEESEGAMDIDKPSPVFTFERQDIVSTNASIKIQAEKLEVVQNQIAVATDPDVLQRLLKVQQIILASLKKLEDSKQGLGLVEPHQQSLPPLPQGSPAPNARKTYDSVNELVEWLITLKIFPVRDLASPPKPEQLPSFCRDPLFEPVSRAEAIKSTLEPLVARKEYHGNDPRQDNPLIATQAAPGTGKSFFIDQIAKLSPADDVVKQVKGAGLLVGSWIPIPVIFSQFSMIYIDEKYGMSLDHGLASRMLFTFIMDFSSQAEISFDEFLYYVSPTLLALRTTTLPSVCNYILTTSAPFAKSSILLLVDELLKVGDGRAKKLLHLIGSVQDTFSIKFRSVITSLNISTLRNSATESGRRVLFVPLPLFSHADALRALEAYLKRTPTKERHEFQVLISDCAGHARTLEMLCKVWDPRYRFNYIQDELLKAVDAPADHRVALAITADRVPLTQVLLGGSTIEDDIKAGYFINSIPSLGDITVIPQLSLLQLRKCALSGPLASLVSIPTNPIQIADWKAFEKFCHYWEVVSRTYPHCDSNTILGRYLRPSLSLKSKQTFESFEQSDLPLKMGKLEIEEVPGHIKNDLASDQFTVGRLYYSKATNNPGFDYCYPAQTPCGKHILICVECKSSSTSASNDVKQEEICSKLALVKAALEPSGKCQWKKRSLARVYVFFMAMRKVADDTLNTIHFAADNLIVGIVLDRERLFNLFGPSLFARAEFLAAFANSGAAVLTGIGAK